MSEIVVITGASAGVGRATAQAFGKRGAKVALLARGVEGLRGAAEEVERAGGEAMILPVDVASAAQVEEAAVEIENQWGPIDVWVNDAMTTVFAPFTEISAEEFHRATEVTYLGFVYGTMAALKRMVPRDHGTVVQVGSALAYRAIPLQSAYCGAKFAIRGFTDSIRAELLHKGSQVHLTMVQLPALNTPQFSWCETRLPNKPQPVPPIFQPEVAAEAIVWAAHHRRREVAVGASSSLTILASKFFPGLLDRYLGATGYDSQQTDEPTAKNRPSNLFEPVPGDHGAHGSFDERARSSSYQWWLNQRRRSVLGICAAAGAAALFAASARYSKSG